MVYAIPIIRQFHTWLNKATADMTQCQSTFTVTLEQSLRKSLPHSIYMVLECYDFLICPEQELSTIQVNILEIIISNSILNTTIFNAQNSQWLNIQCQLVEAQPEGIEIDHILHGHGLYIRIPPQKQPFKY